MYIAPAINRDIIKHDMPKYFEAMLDGTFS
jgi:hypothetical protein